MLLFVLHVKILISKRHILFIIFVSIIIIILSKLVYLPKFRMILHHVLFIIRPCVVLVKFWLKKIYCYFWCIIVFQIKWRNSQIQVVLSTCCYKCGLSWELRGSSWKKNKVILILWYWKRLLMNSWGPDE